MSIKWQFKSVRTRQAVWFLVVAMVPLLAVITILYVQRSAAIRQTEFANLQTVRDLKVRELNRWLDERTADLHTMTGDDEVQVLDTMLKSEQITPEGHRRLDSQE